MTRFWRWKNHITLYSITKSKLAAHLLITFYTYTHAHNFFFLSWNVIFFYPYELVTLWFFFFFVQTKINFYVCLKTKLFLNFLLHFSYFFAPAESEIFTHCDFYYYCLIKRYLIYFTEIYWHSKNFISHFTWAAFGETDNKQIFELPIITLLQLSQMKFSSHQLFFCYLTLTLYWKTLAKKSLYLRTDWTRLSTGAVAFAVMKNRRWEKKAFAL